MEHYYVTKSGMQMYDLSRAYGLGLILQGLSGSLVNVKDFGHYYLLEVHGKCNLKNISKLASLPLEESNKKWGYVFLTIKGNVKKMISEVRDCRNLIIDKKLISSVLDRSKTIVQPDFFTQKKGYKTLYQSLDLGATKGFRENIRCKSYHTGTQLYILPEDFVLSVLGHLHFTIWKWKMEKKAGQLIMIMFSPSTEGVRVGTSPDARDITKIIEKSLRIHGAGIKPTLSYAAISLAKEILQKNVRTFFKFSNLIFGIMVGSGKQRKPYGGGVYPLDFLYRIIDSSKKAGEIFDEWLNIFRVSNRPGYEELAFYLSEFITYPSEETLDRYLRSHLRMFLNNGKIKLYEKEVIKEVIKIV